MLTHAVFSHQGYIYTVFISNVFRIKFETIRLRFKKMLWNKSSISSSPVDTKLLFSVQSTVRWFGLFSSSQFASHFTASNPCGFTLPQQKDSGDPMRSSTKLVFDAGFTSQNLPKLTRNVNLHSCARALTERISTEVMMLHHCTMTRTKWSCRSGGKHSKCSQAHNLE